MIIEFISKQRAYIFPFILLIVLITFTAAKVNGSSIGYFNTVLFKDQQKNNGLIVGHPQPIRSDELETNTPLTVAQTKAGFPLINKNIGNGQDMAVVSDVPYKSWSELFIPQNWSFFVLPVDYAFAFKWWFIGFFMMLCCYLFCLQLLPRKYLLSSIVAGLLFLSPFVQWWYQSITAMPLAYGFLIAFIALRILNRAYDKRRLLLWTALLAYLFTCFALVLYLPFLLPIALVVASFLIGHFLNLLQKNAGRQVLFKKAACIILAALTAIAISFMFLKSHSVAIKAIQTTVYPGHRVDPSGGFDLRRLSGGYYNMQLQNNSYASNLPAPLNQSEVSNFILIFPFLIPALIYLGLIKAKDKKMVDWRVIFLIGLFVVFLVRLFVPFSEFIFNFSQINRLPHDRLLIGLGILNVMLLVITIEKLGTLKQKLNQSVVWASAGFAFLYTALIGFSIRSSYKDYLSSGLKIILISLIIAVVVWLVLKKQFVLAISALVLFSILSVAKVDPLYRGLSPLVNSSLSQSLQQFKGKNGRWVVSEDVIFENFIAANNLHTLSGVYSYPQLDLWKPLGTNKQTKDVYNRYAHVFFTVENIPTSVSKNGAYLDPPALDAFRVHLDPCGTYAKQEKVKYIFTSKDESDLRCLKQIKTVVYPAITFRIYQVQ
jgi:hypothetical protein